MRQIKLKVFEMTCAACSARVEKALSQVPGVASAVVNLATSRATVMVEDEDIAEAQLIEAVEKAGYTATGESEDVERSLLIEGMT